MYILTMKKNKTLKKRQRQRGGGYTDSRIHGCPDDPKYPNRFYRKQAPEGKKPLVCQEKLKPNEYFDDVTGWVKILGREKATPVPVNTYIKAKEKCPNGYRRNKEGVCIHRQEYLDELQRIRDERAKVLATIVEEESKERLDIIKEIDDVADVDVENKEAKLNLFSEELSQKEAIINEERRLIEEEKDKNKSQLAEITERENTLLDKYIEVGEVLDTAEAKIAAENNKIVEENNKIAERKTELDRTEKNLNEQEKKLTQNREELSEQINEERRLIEEEKDKNESQLAEITERENTLLDKYIEVGEVLDTAEAKIAAENKKIAERKTGLDQTEKNLNEQEINLNEQKKKLTQKREELSEQQSKIENVLKKNTLETQRILSKITIEQTNLQHKRTKFDEEKKTYDETVKKLEIEKSALTDKAQILELLFVTQKEENAKTALRLQLWEDELRLREEQHAESELAFFELTEKLIKKETELNEKEFNIQERETEMEAKEIQLTTKIAELNQTKQQIENVLKPMVLAADRTTTKNAEERNRLNSEIDKLKESKRNFELEKKQIIKDAYAKIQEDLEKVKTKQAALNNREKELDIKNESLKQELDKAVKERSKVQQDTDKLAIDKTKMDDLAARRTKIFNKLKNQLEVSENELKASEASLEALKIKLEEEIKKAEEREGAFQGNVNRLFFLPKMYGLSYIENMRKQYYPLIEQNDILYFFDFDQTISDDKGAFGFKRGDSVTKFTRGGQETLDMLNGFTRDGVRWFISTAKYPDAVKTSVYSNIVQRRINLSKIPIAEGDTFQEPVIQEADNNFGIKRGDEPAVLTVAEMSDFVSPSGKKKISYFNNVLTTSPDEANVGLDKWYSVRFVLDNIKKSGGKMPQLIVFTDDSALNVYNLFKLEGLPKDFFYGVSFMGVIYEPNGAPETGFYETMEKINNEKQFKLIYPDDYIVEGPAMTEYQIMEYQLRRETKYGTPIEEGGEKEEPIVLSKQKLERIVNLISGQGKKNLPKISEAKFREFLIIKGVPVDDNNAAKEGEFNKLCEEVKQILVKEGLYDPKKPDQNNRYFLDMMDDNKEEEVRKKIYDIYRQFLSPVPSYDVEYDDKRMRKSYGLQNTNVLINNGVSSAVSSQVLIRPYVDEDAEKKKRLNDIEARKQAQKEGKPLPPIVPLNPPFNFKTWVGVVGDVVSAKEYLNTTFVKGKIVNVETNKETKYEMLSAGQKKDVKASVMQCLEHFFSMPKIAENKIAPDAIKLKPINRELLIQFLKQRFGPGNKAEDASKYELLPKDKENYATGSIGIRLIDTATFDALASMYEKNSVTELLKAENIQVGKEIVEKKAVIKMDPYVLIEETKAKIKSFEGKELNKEEEAELDNLEKQLRILLMKTKKVLTPPLTDVDVTPPPPPPLTDEQNVKFKKMKTMLPEGAVRQKMNNEGIHKTIIDAFFATKGGRRTRKKRRPKRRRNTKRN